MPYMPQLQDPQKESRKKALKRTKIGIALFLGAFGAAIVGIPTLIVCIGFLFMLGAIGLGIAGFILMIIGGNAFPKPHRILVISSLCLMIFTIFIAIILAFMTVGDYDYNYSWSLTEKEYTGEEIKEDLEPRQNSSWTPIVTTIFTSAAWGMLFFMPSKKWGRIMIVVYIGLAIMLAVAASVFQYAIIENEKNSIDDNEQFTQTEKNKIDSDLSLKLILPSLLGLLPFILLIIIAFGAYSNVKKLEQELEYKPPSPLHPTYI